MKVRSFDYKNKDKEIIETSEVGETFTFQADELFTIKSLDNLELTGTRFHPLYTGKGSFKTIHDLALSDFLFNEKFKPSAVKSLKWDIEFFSPIPVYNFHVKNTETYFANNIAVHNKRSPDYETPFY